MMAMSYHRICGNYQMISFAGKFYNEIDKNKKIA
jgi:hypothetical protein